MPRSFAPTTAELVVDVVEAVVAFGGEATIHAVSEFTDQPETQASDALKMAEDLGLLDSNNGMYRTYSPLCRYVLSPDVRQKAAVIRIVLDSYQPFLRFKERLASTDSPNTAAEQTKVLLGLEAHRGEIKETLISLGTYGQVLAAEGGGRYRIEEAAPVSPLRALADACKELAEAETVVRDQLGAEAAAVVSREEVIRPLADGLWRARGRDASGAVQQAGNAVESFLNELAGRVQVDLSGATGINAKVESLQRNWRLPKKLANVGKYLGHIRNAADHGIDDDIGYSWDIRDNTALEYIFVAWGVCISFCSLRTA